MEESSCILWSVNACRLIWHIWLNRKVKDEGFANSDIECKACSLAVINCHTTWALLFCLNGLF